MPEIKQKTLDQVIRETKNHLTGVLGRDPMPAEIVDHMRVVFVSYVFEVINNDKQTDKTE